jgi:hypothetical protein
MTPFALSIQSELSPMAIVLRVCLTNPASQSSLTSLHPVTRARWIGCRAVR